MEKFQINLRTFVNPHLFFITKPYCNDSLNNISILIENYQRGKEEVSCECGEMVAAFYESVYARARIMERELDQKNNKFIYLCWLVDYGVFIETDKVFKIPDNIQNISPLAIQACLNNICYLEDHLELGVTGEIKKVKSAVPSSGVTQYILDVLLTDYTELVFEVVEHYNNVLVGELLIYKNGKVLNLTQELCKEGLLATDKNIFDQIKNCVTDYFKEHCLHIHNICKNQKIFTSNINSPDKHVQLSPTKFDEEIDIDNYMVIENGRRRKGMCKKTLGFFHTSESECDKSINVSSNNKDHSQEINGEVEHIPTSSPKVIDGGISEKSGDLNTPSNEFISSQNTSTEENVAQLNKTLKTHKISPIVMKQALQKLKQKGSSGHSKELNEENLKLEIQKSDKNSSDHGSRTDSAIKKLAALKRNRISSNSNQSEEETRKSPFSDITSQRKSKPSGLFVPSGMEGRVIRGSQKKSVESPPRTRANNALIKKRQINFDTSSAGDSDSIKVTNFSDEDENEKHQHTVDSNSPVDDDCTTVKILGRENTSDNQILTTSSDVEFKKENEEEKSSSGQNAKDLITKGDILKAVTGCDCTKCRIAVDEDDWDSHIRFAPLECESKTKHRSGPVIKPPKIFKDEEKDLVQENEILSVEYGEMSVMEKKLSRKILVHGECIPNPITRIVQSNIHEDIQKNLDRLNYTETKRIQQYAFPAITRNQNVFMIGDAESGKTMAYLPVMVSFALEKDARYSHLLKMGGGPFVVIICSNSRKCEEVYDLTKLIFGRHRNRLSLVTYPGHGNISNIDILITMPNILTSLIATRAINFKRLCHFVLEDGDVILKSHYDLVEKFLKYGDQVLNHRNCPKSIQIILCANHWTLQIENLMKKLKKVPLVCIGNHLEAALYGKMEFTMKFLDTSCKEQNLQNILKDVYKYTKSVVICTRDEMLDIETFLPLKGIEFSAINGQTTEEILYSEQAWTKASPGNYSVLICTDDIYNTMDITSAQLLIHYSLPTSWSQFIRRFSCLLENNETPLNTKERKNRVSSFVFIDESCEQRMSKFCNFIKIAGLENKLPDKIKSFFREVATEKEYKKISHNIELCETLKIFAKCHSLQCKKRHVLNRELDHSDILPKNGSIHFKIAKMTNTTSLSIKILEVFDLQGHIVEKFEDQTNSILEILRENDQYYYTSKAILNHLYLHKDVDKYERCKVVEINENENFLVYLIDRGIYCKSNLNKLFKMPSKLKKIPPQCYEVYLANLIPPHEDLNFSRSARHKAQFLIDSNCPDSVMTGTVVLQLGNNLWLEDVFEKRDMFDKSLPSIGLQLSRELVKQELAVKSDKPLRELYKLCDNAGIQLPTYKVEKPKPVKVVQQARPQWAHLDMDNVNEVQFSCAVTPGEFYIKQNKFNRQLAQLEDEIRKEICKPFYPVAQKIEIGKCYLARGETSGDYSRVLVLNINEDNVHCFCVDYGDDMVVPASTLKYISNELIRKLPFQSVQCSLHGVKQIDDSWSTEAIDLFYRVGLEDESDIYRILYVKTCSKRPNPLIPDQRSYSVLIKYESNGRQLLLNDLLIDCGLALPDGEEIKDFELPQRKVEEDDDSIEEIIRNDWEDRETLEDEEFKEIDFDPEAFDLEIYNKDAFISGLNLPFKKTNKSRSIEEKETDNLELPPMKAVPAVDYLTPDVYWCQTDSTIKLSIKVTDVVNPKILLIHNRIFQFDTVNSSKKYHLKLILYEKVQKIFEYTVLGPEIRIRFTKCQQEEWPRLLHTKEKMKKIHYDFTTFEVDEKPRQILQLDISDSSSDDENGCLGYHVSSDMDSEYDYDIPNDDR